MAISDKINSIKTHIGEAYTAIQGKEGTIPANKNCENLKNAIESIPTSGKTQEKTVTPTESQQIATPDAGYDGLSKVTVEAIPPDYVIPSGTVQITENGVVDVSGKANANVNVPTGVDTSDATAVAADIRVGKTAYAKDVKLTGTIEDYDGAASQGSGNYTVKVIDYDGTVLMEKKGNTGDIIELPEAPTHDRLVFQKWSASRTVTDNKVTIGNDNVMVGATYTTASGQNEFDITVTKATGLTVTFNGSGVKDWGDGTSDSQTSHTYTAYGNYMIKWAGSSVPQNVFGSGDVYFLTFARLAGITIISGDAFSGCCSLTSTTIPDGVTSIGDYAFRGCYSLTSITIPDGVTSIGIYTFFKCFSLTSITIPDGVTSIGNGAFQTCYSLTSITIPDGVTIISGDAFRGCFSLTSTTIPDGVTSIGNGAFQTCYSLTSITIPDGVTSISSSAFQSCFSLTSITIPDGVTSIGNGAFQSCYSLTSITIPDGVTSISHYVFSGCFSLTSITIPDGVTSIGNGAFQTCYSLTSITIPDGVTSISSSAFQSCFSLTSITIPDGVTSIGDYAFQTCYSLTKYDFSQATAVPTLSNTSAFNSINKICKIVVPDNLYDQWIAATNWSTYADYIYKASEVV